MENGNATKKHAVIYDGDCGFCSTQVKWLARFDWLKKFEFFSLTDPRVKKIAPALAQEDLLKAIHCVAKDGKIFRAARCLRFIGMRMPLFFLPALILWIPGMLWIAEKIYERIARNRHFLSGVFNSCKSERL